jgi:hypothetical protein
MECDKMESSNLIKTFKSYNQLKLFFFCKCIKCSSKCGNGFQTREAFCGEIGSSTDLSLCDLHKFPLTKKACFLKSCNEWIAEDWSKVSNIIIK